MTDWLSSFFILFFIISFFIQTSLASKNITKKRENFCSLLLYLFVGVDGFEPPTLCL